MLSLLRITTASLIAAFRCSFDFWILTFARKFDTLLIPDMANNNNNNTNQRLPRVTLELIDEGEADQELRTSAWFITINTNRTATTPEEYQTLKTGLSEVIRSLQDYENLKRIIIFTSRINVKPLAQNRFTDGPRRYELDSLDKIESVEFRARIEKSPSSAPRNPNRVHMHIYLKITHRSNIHLNQEEIKSISDEILRAYGVNGVYVHIRTANTGADNIVRYLGKPQI